MGSKDMRLTNDIALTLTSPAGKSEHFEWDDAMPGFGLRLRGAARRWVVQYRVGIQQRRESLGDPRKVRIEDARKVARARFAAAELGKDPAGDRAQARETAEAAKRTLAVVADMYLDAKEDRLRKRTYNAAKLHLTGHWKPLRSRPLAGITRADIAARLQEIIREHGRRAAAAARRNLSALYSWAMREGIVESNPVIATNNPAEGMLARDRVLTDAELRTIWNTCSAMADTDGGKIVKLLLLTGCRREEIGGLRRDEVDEHAVLTIAGARTKNRHTLTLPLPDAARDILRSVPQREGRVHYFGRRVDTPYSGWGPLKLTIDAKIAVTTASALKPWVLHDLRRTMRTGLGKLGVQPHIAELCINHVKGGVEAIYDRHKYHREIGEALALWAEHVLGVVEGREPRVVSLRS
jgi:integrase